MSCFEIECFDIKIKSFISGAYISSYLDAIKIEVHDINCKLFWFNLFFSKYLSKIFKLK